MQPKKILIERWKSGIGKNILNKINEFCFKLQMPKHGQSSDTIFLMLDGLPYREEISNGRDLRGIQLGGGVHELDFSATDFSYSSLQMNFVNCNLSNSIFYEAQATNCIFLNQLSNADFKRAKLNGCFFHNAVALNCHFDESTLKNASFENALLNGSFFVDCNCQQAKFLGANLLNCDFRNANLEEAVMQNAKLDNTTDLRGANLKNLFYKDKFDIHGNLVAKGIEWKVARYDDNTIF